MACRTAAAEEAARGSSSAGKVEDLRWGAVAPGPPGTRPAAAAAAAAAEAAAAATTQCYVSPNFGPRLAGAAAAPGKVIRSAAQRSAAHRGAARLRCPGGAAAARSSPAWPA
ncbi:Protein of unknown function [Gryllus bimaculatus]|nr:Protein of unknown function [Gryllus bimaculatus]